MSLIKDISESKSIINKFYYSIIFLNLKLHDI